MEEEKETSLEKKRCREDLTKTTVGMEREYGMPMVHQNRSRDELHRRDKGEKKIKDKIWGWLNNLMIAYLEVTWIFNNRQSGGR